jgi:hypothetical protein
MGHGGLRLLLRTLDQVTDSQLYGQVNNFRFARNTGTKDQFPPLEVDIADLQAWHLCARCACHMERHQQNTLKANSPA